MTEQEYTNPQQNNNPANIVTPKRVAAIRLVSDLLLLALTFVFTYEALDFLPARIVLISVAAIAAATLIGYILVQRGRNVLGMGFILYGLILGLSSVSVFVERLGPFTLITLVVMTTLSVSFSMPQRRVMEAISASVIFGSASMIFDLNLRGAAFRLSPPEMLTNVLWGVVLMMVVLFLYVTFRQFPYFPFRAKIITAFTLITILSLSVLGFFNSRSVESVLTREANEALFNAASQTEDNLQQFINYNLQSIKTEAQLPVLVQYASQTETQRQNTQDMASQTLVTLANKDPEFIASYALLDLQGNVLLDTEASNIGANEAALNAFSAPIQKGGPVMSDVEMAPNTGEPSLYFSAPVIENGSIIVGILRVRYQAGVLQNLIENSNGRGGNNSFAVLFDENLIHLAHGIAPETIFTTVVPLSDDTFEELVESRRLPDQSQQATFLDLPDLAQHLNQAQITDSGVVYFDATDIATGDLLNRVVVVRMDNPNWLLAFFQPQAVYLSPIENLASNTIFLSLISGFGTVLIAIILTQVLVTPIMKLNDSAREIARGNLNTRVEIESDDEIGTLGKTFNQMAARLQNLVENLENQVRRRTKDLENQALQLKAATEVARDATSELHLQDMLDRAATLIHDRFGFYHVGIYLKDNNGEYAILAASQDRPGQLLLEDNHRFKIDIESNVGFTSILGEAKISSTQDPNAPIQYHPLLPSSQAQLCLPLNLADQTLGVIDIHSTNPIAFTQDEVQVFQTLADQIAIAIQKARFNQEIQETLNELETAYGTFTQKAWQRFIQNRAQTSGYRFKSMKTEPVFEVPQQVQKAWQQGGPVEVTPAASGDPDQQTSVLAIPMKVRGEVIGVLNLEFESDQIPADTSELVEEIAERLSLILENARLIETARNQVDREQLASHITTTIRQSLDMDVVLRTAVQEIGQSLNLPEVEIRLGSVDQTPKSTPKANGNSSSNNTD